MQICPPAPLVRQAPRGRIDKPEENLAMAFVKKNPWVVLVGLFAILIAVGIGVS